MATSGTYNFSLSNADCVFEAFDRCKIRGTALTGEHMLSARASINLELMTWSNRGVNLWAVDLQTLNLSQGVSQYTLAPETVLLLDTYIETTATGADPIDRIMKPVSRSDWAMIPDKSVEGPPTIYWLDRITPPVLNVWQPPDGNGPYVLKYYRMRRLQDADISMGQTPDFPFRFYDAFCSGMTMRLAEKYAPAQYEAKSKIYKAAWAEAWSADREHAPLRIIPDLSSYYQ